MKKISISLTLLFLIILSLISSGFAANLEVFTKYNTDIKIQKNNTFEIQKRILLRNVHDVGIVPGEIQFKIYKPSQNKNVNLTKLNVTNRYNNKIKHTVHNVDDGYVILLDIFTPVLPGFDYMINIDMQANYEPTGFFFRNLQIPLKENSEIPIKDGQITVTLPDSYHLTYMSFKNNQTIIQNNTIIWTIDSNTPETVNIEYSAIPINIFGLKGSVVFWVLINLILITTLIIHIKKALNKNKPKSKKHKKKHK